MATFSQGFVEEMVAQGYKTQGPDPEVEKLDNKIVARHPCQNCGGETTYLPFTKDDSYRAFALCSKCGALWEF